MVYIFKRPFTAFFIIGSVTNITKNKYRVIMVHHVNDEIGFQIYAYVVGLSLCKVATENDILDFNSGKII